jgi:hypothetical protein
MDYLSIEEQRAHIIAWAKTVEKQLLDLELSMAMNSDPAALRDQADRLAAGLAGAKRRLAELEPRS